MPTSTSMAAAEAARKKTVALLAGDSTPLVWTYRIRLTSSALIRVALLFRSLHEKPEDPVVLGLLDHGMPGPLLEGVEVRDGPGIGRQHLQHCALLDGPDGLGQLDHRHRACEPPAVQRGRDLDLTHGSSPHTARRISSRPCRACSARCWARLAFETPRSCSSAP